MTETENNRYGWCRYIDGKEILLKEKNPKRKNILLGFFF